MRAASTTGRWRPAVHLTLAAALSVALAACTAPQEETDDERDPVARLEATELAVPADMVADGTGVHGVAVLAASGALPTGAVGLLADPGEAPRAASWTLDADGARETPLDVGVRGVVVALDAAAAADGFTAVVGHTWLAGRTTSFVLTSTDRASWTPVDLPPEQADLRLSRVAVEGRTVYAVGEVRDGSVGGVVVTGADVEGFTLPPVGPEEVRRVAGVAGHGDEVLVVADAGPAVEDQPVVAYVSGDRGQTWDRATIDPDGRADASGAVWTGTQYVVTGTAPADGDPTGRPAAWAGDGGRWTREDVPAPGWDFLQPGLDAGLDAPSAGGGRVAAVAWSQATPFSGVYRREVDGTWRWWSERGPGEAPGVGGRTAVDDDGAVVAAIGAHGGVEVGVAGAEGAWEALDVLATRVDWYRAAEAFDGTRGPRVAAVRPTFTVTDDGAWTQGSAGALFALEDGVLEASAWEPEGANGRSSVVVHHDDAAGDVVLTNGWNAELTAIEVAGWHRAGEDLPWVAADGFETGATAWVYDVAHSTAGWIAAGAYRADTRAGTPIEAAVWVSPDGERWSRVPGLAAAGLDSTGTAVCRLPDGGAIVVGRADLDDVTHPSEALAWTVTDGAWRSVGLPDRPTAWFSGCAVAGDAVVVEGQTASATLWRTTDGQTFEEVHAAAVGESIGGVRALEGGFVAFGSVDRAEYTGPVVWVSADGTDWSWLAVPAREPVVAGLVHPVGRGLLVVVSTSSGDQAWTVADVPVPAARP